MPCLEPRPRRDTCPTCPCTSTSSPREQTVCVHTAPGMCIRCGTITEPVTPGRYATSSLECCCPLTAASRGILDIGKSRRAFVRARMWSRGPLHCSVMTLACQNLFRFESSGNLNTLGFHCEDGYCGVRGGDVGDIDTVFKQMLWCMGATLMYYWG